MFYTNSFTVPATDVGVDVVRSDGGNGYEIPLGIAFSALQIIPVPSTLTYDSTKYEIKGGTAGSDWIVVAGMFVLEGIAALTTSICSIRPLGGVGGDAFTCNILLKERP